MSARVFSWDWKEQPPMDAISAAVTATSAHGRVFMIPVPETSSVQYAVVVSDVELTAFQALEFYNDPWAVVRVEVIIEPPTGTITEVIEIDVAELAGLDGPARQQKITEIASGHVNDVCSWGTRELDGNED